jgi:hypothetical protein
MIDLERMFCLTFLRDTVRKFRQLPRRKEKASCLNGSRRCCESRVACLKKPCIPFLGIDSKLVFCLPFQGGRSIWLQLLSVRRWLVSRRFSGRKRRVGTLQLTGLPQQLARTHVACLASPSNNQHAMHPSQTNSVFAQTSLLQQLE